MTDFSGTMSGSRRQGCVNSRATATVSHRRATCVMGNTVLRMVCRPSLCGIRTARHTRSGPIRWTVSVWPALSMWMTATGRHQQHLHVAGTGAAGRHQQHLHVAGTGAAGVAEQLSQSSSYWSSWAPWAGLPTSSDQHCPNCSNVPRRVGTAP